MNASWFVIYNPLCWGLIPYEIRPHICAALAASQADKSIFNIGQPDIIGPAIAADGDRVAAAVVGSIDEQAVDGHVAPPPG